MLTNETLVYIADLVQYTENIWPVKLTNTNYIFYRIIINYWIFQIHSLLLSIEEDSIEDESVNGDVSKSPPGRPQRKERKDFPVSVCVCGNVSCRGEGDVWKECCALLIFLFSFYRNLLLTACRPLLKSWWVTSSHTTYAELNANISLFNSYLLRSLFLFCIL